MTRLILGGVLAAFLMFVAPGNVVLARGPCEARPSPAPVMTPAPAPRLLG